MTDDEDEIAKRIRLAILDSLEIDRESQARLDRTAKPSDQFVNRMFLKKGEFYFSVGVAFATSAVVTVILYQALSFLSIVNTATVERFCWIVLAILTAVKCGYFVAAAMVERTLDLARGEERAVRVVSTLEAVLADLELEFPGAVPRLDRILNYDIDEATPLVDRAIEMRRRKP